ncbi:PREDICTED: pentatricopeptide repeat-containing protein At5g41170, mitochondrial-like [Fragaria vesca subsp. vesca]|uniref:pentatricopeptide repeat-containing protein At5g41170, mitochondrial-like n=1 Tax=Fragaria vesca subsp. vesca TaxID=101020 RepID=UPI0002C33497|nr:PREDICTED: pentatricopeptide repeat-containing protein At5g41170, mitochondrial-like [Fragaria vesca subsp. vesca]
MALSLSLMPSPYPVRFKLVQTPFSYRSRYIRTQQGRLLTSKALSCSATELAVDKRLTSSKDIGFYSHSEEPKLGFDEITSRLHVQSLVERIRALPTRETSQILSIFEQDGCFKTISEFNDMLLALAVAKMPDVALSLYSQISSYCLVPDSSTFSVVITCYCEKNDLDEAKRVLVHMIENGFNPSVATITFVIDSLCKKGRLQRALEVFEVMGRVGSKPSVQMYNCLLKGLCYVGRVEDAYDMLMKIKKGVIQPDIYTYTAVMDGFCKVGRTDEAMELLNDAVELGLILDVVAFNTLFDGYCREGRAMEGLNVLKQMKERNCIPDYITYSTLIHGLLKWGKTRNALRIYKEMVEVGFEVDERLTNDLVRGLCRRSTKEKDLLEDACELFEKLQNGVSDIDASTYGLMIQSLCMGKKIDDAMINLKQMLTVGYSPRMITFNNVIQSLCAEEKMIDALLVLGTAYKFDRVASRVSYNLLIQKLNQHGSMLEACTVYGAALKRGLIPNKKPQQ